MARITKPPTAPAAGASAKRTKRLPGGSGTMGGIQLAVNNVMAGPPPCPSHLTLRPQDRPFWDAILRARAIDEWGRIELNLAQQLARCQADIASLEGMVDSGDRKRMEEAGYPSVHAVNQNISSLIARQLSLMRSLQIIGSVIGDPVDNIPRRKAEREAEQTLQRIKGGGTEDDMPPLLAT